jgi:hypothetical protein
LKQRLEDLAPSAPATLPPNAADIYQRQVADLQAALNDPAVKAAAVETLRGLVAKIVLTPDETQPDGSRVELHGALAAILHLGQQQKAGKSNDLPLFGTDVLEERLSLVWIRNHLDLLLTG